MVAGSLSAPRRIVVGVDGSVSSLHALEWAARQAELTESPLDVVMSWQLPGSRGWAAPLPDDWDPEEDLRRSLDAIVAKLLAAHPGLVVETRVVEGHPAPVLVEASKGSDLLVVGSRGHGAYAGMHLGSVSEHCATFAACPVLVFRAVV